MIRKYISLTDVTSQTAMPALALSVSNHESSLLREVEWLEWSRLHAGVPGSIPGANCDGSF